MHDRVVWLSDNGAEFGYVRWIGHVVDGDSILAGVAFVSSIIPCIGMLRNSTNLETSSFA